MSLPQTEEEHQQAAATLRRAGPADNLVSTACFHCKVRFAMLAQWRRKPDGEPDWFLRCTVCGAQCMGELKGAKYGHFRGAARAPEGEQELPPADTGVGGTEGDA